MQAQASPPRRDSRQWEKVSPGLWSQSGSDNYRSVVYENGRERKVYFRARNRTEAKQKHEDRRVNVRKGQEPDKSTATVADVATDFLAMIEGLVQAGEMSPRTHANYSQRWRTHLEPTFGRVRVQSLRPEQVSRWLSEIRGRGSSSWTVRGAYTFLGQVLEHAQTRNLIVETPLRRISKTERPQARNKTDARRLTDKECSALIEHALPSSRALVAMIVFTGLRQGEALGLTWQDVDFDQGIISVRFQLARKTKGAATRRLPLKTKAGRRDVEALPELIALLKKHKAEAFARGNARPEDFLFCTEEGRPLMHRNVSRDFATAGDRAGLNPKEGEEAERVSLHDLRHTAACRLIACGLDVVTVQRQLGHASPAITLRLYGGEFETAKRRDTIRGQIAASGLGAVLNGKS
jgi:integrase